MQQLWNQIVAALEYLPRYLSQHVQITIVALLAGIAISLPLAILATRRASLRWPLLTFAGVLQTIPSIALLVLVYAALLGGRSLLQIDVPAISFIAAVVALTLYSMLPVMRNTVTGILNVDPAMIEAARGVGMTDRQMLWKVQLPLAAPVIIAGIRTATVWVVGIATLSTPVGQTSLGDYIFTGLQLQNWGSVVLGCTLAGLLAIVLDMLIALLQQAAEKRSRSRGIIGAIGLLIVIGGGIAAPLLVPRADFLVGAKTFDEQFILASLIRDALNEAGFKARKRQGLGSTVAFTSLVNDQIDCYVDYSGTIWAVQMKRGDAADAATVLHGVSDWLQREHGVVCLGRIGFENAYALAMRRDRAESLGIRSIHDLSIHAGDLSIGGDYEFFDRPEWKKIRDAYGLHFAEQRRFQSTLMYEALKSGEVDVISAFSSDGRIAAYDLFVLDDPRRAIPPYDAILLVGPKASLNKEFLAALRPLIESIDDDLMRQANHMVDRAQDKRSADEAARWLAERMAQSR